MLAAAPATAVGVIVTLITITVVMNFRKIHPESHVAHFAFME